jgi:hypothetical protein
MEPISTHLPLLEPTDELCSGICLFSREANKKPEEQPDGKKTIAKNQGHCLKAKHRLKGKCRLTEEQKDVPRKLRRRFQQVADALAVNMETDEEERQEKVKSKRWRIGALKCPLQSDGPTGVSSSSSCTLRLHGDTGSVRLHAHIGSNLYLAELNLGHFSEGRGWNVSAKHADGSEIDAVSNHTDNAVDGRSDISAAHADISESD